MVFVFKFLRQSEVRQDDVSVFADENVFGFEVAIDDSVRMQMFKCKRNLSGVKASTLGREAAFVFEVEEKFASIDIIHHKMKFCWSLKKTSKKK